MRAVPLVILSSLGVFLLALACSDADNDANGDGVRTLTITRFDGSETVIELLEGPSVCGRDREQGIIWLCGTNLEGIFVDYIWVNESLGETYSVEPP